jgi:hypothetical protein
LGIGGGKGNLTAVRKYSEVRISGLVFLYNDSIDRAARIMDTGCGISKDRTASQVIHIFPAGVSCFNSYLHLTTLAPDIVAAILDETLPSEVTLFDLAAGTPLVWEEQRARAGGNDETSVLAD